MIWRVDRLTGIAAQVRRLVTPCSKSTRRAQLTRSSTISTVGFTAASRGTGDAKYRLWLTCMGCSSDRLAVESGGLSVGWADRIGFREKSMEGGQLLVRVQSGRSAVGAAKVVVEGVH
jgi:hypothetical protein